MDLKVIWSNLNFIDKLTETDKLSRLPMIQQLVRLQVRLDHWFLEKGPALFQDGKETIISSLVSSKAICYEPPGRGEDMNYNESSALGAHTGFLHECW